MPVTSGGDQPPQKILEFPATRLYLLHMNIGTIVVATPAAPFTSEQRKRLGMVLGVEGLRAHVEWTDLNGWKTKVWILLTWIDG